MTLNPLLISGMVPPLALPSTKGLFSLSQCLTIKEAKRGPSLSLCTLRGPRAHLLDCQKKKQKEKENKSRVGSRKERKRQRAHTLIHTRPSSPPVPPKTKRGEDEERGRGRTRTGKEKKRRRDAGIKRWKKNSPFIVSQLGNEGGCWYRGERLSREQCVCLCVCVCVYVSQKFMSLRSCEVCFWKCVVFVCVYVGKGDSDRVTASLKGRIKHGNMWLRKSLCLRLKKKKDAEQRNNLVFISSDSLWRSCGAHIHWIIAVWVLLRAGVLIQRWTDGDEEALKERKEAGGDFMGCNGWASNQIWIGWP